MSHFAVLVIGEDVDKQLAPYQENNMDDCPKEYLEFIEDEDAEYDEETKKNGYWENPNCKWDWWTVGGRWSESLKLNHSAQYVNSALVKDIDFEAMEKAAVINSKEQWNSYLEDKEKNGDFSQYLYGVKEGDTRETYIERRKKFYTFAVLKDGEWYERGDMGWWGLVVDEKDPKDWQDEFDKLIKGLPGDTLLTIVDCHI